MKQGVLNLEGIKPISFIYDMTQEQLIKEMKLVERIGNKDGLWYRTLKQLKESRE